MRARWLLMRSIKSRRKRYEACDDVVPVVGLDLPCAAGHLGLQSAPSALLRALGFEPRRQEISNTPGGGVAYLAGSANFEDTKTESKPNEVGLIRKGGAAE